LAALNILSKSDCTFKAKRLFRWGFEVVYRLVWKGNMQLPTMSAKINASPQAFPTFPPRTSSLSRRDVLAKHCKCASCFLQKLGELEGQWRCALTFVEYQQEMQWINTSSCRFVDCMSCIVSCGFAIASVVIVKCTSRKIRKNMD